MKIKPSCDFEYFDENNISSTNIPFGTLVATCSHLEYPINLVKLVTYENRELKINSVGEGNLVEKCKKCIVYKRRDDYTYYKFVLLCQRCEDNATGKKNLAADLDLRPILTEYFDY